MKRLFERIGKMTEKRSESKVTRTTVDILTTILFVFLLASCQKEPWYGQDGRPGDAFIALTWQVEEPTYIDAGTHAIPPVFHYGEYYPINPGFYNFYYEGRVWTGMNYAYYAWEVDYEIRILAGEPGNWYYHGTDGPDNYFMIEMSPYGPYLSSDFKNAVASENTILVSDSEDKIVVKQTSEGMELEITYTPVEITKLREVKE